jgi:hypothetical protein
MRKSYSVSLDLYYMYRQGKNIKSLYIYALRDILERYKVAVSNRPIQLF